MPIGTDSANNSNMVIDVAPGGQRLTLTYPSRLQDGFGIMQSDTQGGMQWLPQYVQGIVGNDDNHSSGTCSIAQDGTSQLINFQPLVLNPFSRRVCIGVEIRVRTYLASPTADSVDIFASLGQCLLAFDPTAISLNDIWTTTAISVIGPTNDLLNDIAITVTRTRGNAATVTPVLQGNPQSGGTKVDFDIQLYTPYAISSAPVKPIPQ